jgi:[acyl-carrier-protein] S-malonyltransferase
MLALLFPGQGIDLSATLAAWDGHSAYVSELLDHAASAAGVLRSGLTARECPALDRTEVLQPVITALSLGIARELTARGADPAVVVGHSLGEVAALAMAGVFTPGGAVALSAIRGRAMAREAARKRGGMGACHAAASDVKCAIRAAGADGVAIAAYNAPAQTAVSGEESQLRRLARAITLTRLPVAGAWHSAAMADAVDEVRRAAERRLVGPPTRVWVANRHGLPVDSESEVPRLLAEQLVHPVQWIRSMQTLRELGVSEVIALAAKPLRALAQECLGAAVRVRRLMRPERLEDLCRAWAG